MDGLIDWCGFFGAWLLVAGPMAQGARELAEEDFERDEMAKLMETVEQPDPISGWWWLLPPVRYAKSQQRTRVIRDAVVEKMPEDQLRALFRLRFKAEVWLVISLGAMLIATKETWELVEFYEWPEATFWVLIVVMALLSLANTIIRIHYWNKMENQA